MNATQTDTVMKEKIIMQTKEIISSIWSYVHGAQDSSSFILLHEHSKVFKIICTNCLGKVRY